MSEQGRERCLTMHQPWASLLVYGIKRIEGRSWPAPLRGRLWIHAASKVPGPETIQAMENFYKEIYAVDGITSIKFPEHYPVSVLLGCVNVVGCLKQEELICWEEIPQSVRLEAQTDFCWLCEEPQRLLVPFEMRGWQGVYNLEKRIIPAALKGLRPVEGPTFTKFPIQKLPDFSSCEVAKVSSSKSLSTLSPSLNASIAGAQQAAAQFRSQTVGQGSSSQGK